MKSKIKDVRQFYDQETQKYIQERYTGNSCEHFAYQSRKAIVLGMLSKLKGSILDVGCGPAIYSHDLITEGFLTVSVDLSYEMLITAKRLMRVTGESILWINSELEQLPFHNGIFDNVLAIGVIAYASNAEDAIQELCRVIKPNGFMIIQCSNTLCPASKLIALKDIFLTKTGIRNQGYKFNLTTFSYSRFRCLLEESGFRIIQKRSYDFRIPFVEKFLPKIAVSLMKKFHNLMTDSRIFGWFGEGYIVFIQKRS